MLIYTVGIVTLDHNEQIDSIDKLIFCAEELSNKHTELFAQNDMFEILKGLTNKIGQPFDSKHIINKIYIEFPKEYSDPYYHAIGIEIKDEKGEKDFYDVYSLTRWYIENIEKLIIT